MHVQGSFSPIENAPLNSEEYNISNILFMVSDIFPIIASMTNAYQYGQISCVNKQFKKLASEYFQHVHKIFCAHLGLNIKTNLDSNQVVKINIVKLIDMIKTNKNRAINYFMDLSQDQRFEVAKLCIKGRQIRDIDFDLPIRVQVDTELASFIDKLDLTQEQRFKIAKLCMKNNKGTKRHMDKFDLSTDQKIEVFLIYHGLIAGMPGSFH